MLEIKCNYSLTWLVKNVFELSFKCTEFPYNIFLFFLHLFYQIRLKYLREKPIENLTDFKTYVDNATLREGVVFTAFKQQIYIFFKVVFAIYVLQTYLHVLCKKVCKNNML